MPESSPIFIDEHLWTDLELYNLGLMLALACGRSRAPLRRRGRTLICGFHQVLGQEATRRGSPYPYNGPYHSRDFKLKLAA
jgi:hypothetical protein